MPCDRRDCDGDGGHGHCHRNEVVIQVIDVMATVLEVMDIGMGLKV